MIFHIHPCPHPRFLHIYNIYSKGKRHFKVQSYTFFYKMEENPIKFLQFVRFVYLLPSNLTYV
jgi:hypothetical protein